MPSDAKRSMTFDECWLDSTSRRMACTKRRFRWEFYIAGISQGGVESLPPSKAARPGVSFKDIEAIHLAETIKFPGRAEWKPIQLSLFDLKKNRHPVWKWIKIYYDVSQGAVLNHFACTQTNLGFTVGDQFKKTAELRLYDGCGNMSEKWIFEEVWPNNIEFGELDMGDSAVVTCDLTLNYSRAYLVESEAPGDIFDQPFPPIGGGNA